MKSNPEIRQQLYLLVEEHLSKLTATTPALWGSMDAQQMVEHLVMSVELSLGTKETKLQTPQEKVEVIKRVALYSGRPLQKGIKNPDLPERNVGYTYSSLSVAYDQLVVVLNALEQLYEKNPDHMAMHQVFGLLNSNEWYWFHYKHFYHHACQFGLVPEIATLE